MWSFRRITWWQNDRRGDLKPLNSNNIPNFKKINQEYVNPDYDPQNAYTVPYMLCTTGIIYNTTMVDKAPTSWADLWDEQYAGNILMFNNSRDAYAIAAFKSGHDINPQSTEEVDEVVEELKAQKPLVQAYVMDEIFDKMIGGEAAVGVYYSGDAITMIDDNPDLAWVFPEEGSVLSVDCMAIPAASEHQEAAEMFINFMCETDIGKAKRRVHRLHHPHAGCVGGAGRGSEGERDRLSVRRESRQGKGVHFPERRCEQRAGREVERNEELRRGWQQSAVPCAAGSHGSAGLLQHLAQGPQAQPQSVLNAKEAAAQNNVQWSLFIERKTMEQFFYTETMTVMNADADFRSLLKPSALLRYVEQISTDHARAFGMDDQSSKNAV